MTWFKENWFKIFICLMLIGGLGLYYYQSNKPQKVAPAEVNVQPVYIPQTPQPVQQKAQPQTVIVQPTQPKSNILQDSLNRSNQLNAQLQLDRLNRNIESQNFYNNLNNIQMRCVGAGC